MQSLVDSAPFEDAISVVDGDPAHAPSWNQEPLGQASAAQDGYVLADFSHWNIGFAGSIENEVVIDLIGDDWQAVLFSNGYDVFQVSFIKYGSARIGGVVD